MAKEKNTNKEETHEICPFCGLCMTCRCCERFGCGEETKDLEEAVFEKA